MTYDTANVGDTIAYCSQTFGLRPAEPWGEPTTVTAVEDTYYGRYVTVENGDILSSGTHFVSVLRRGNNV